MSYALLALGLIAGMGGYVIAGRVGALGLLRLGGEGEMSDTTMVRNSGESAPPSPRKRLFMVGRLGGKRPGVTSYIWRGRLYTIADSGVPVGLKEHMGGTT